MLSDNIKQLRLERAMTQAELAERLHVVRQTVSKWENGSSVPDALMLQKLAEILDTSPDKLLDCPPLSPEPPSRRPFPLYLKAAIVCGLYLLLTTPLRNAVVSYDSLAFLSPQTVFILWLLRLYVFRPFLVFFLLSAWLNTRTFRLQLPRICRIPAGMMVAAALYCAANCVSLNTLPLPFPRVWGTHILSHPHWLTLWLAAAAFLLQLSPKENSHDTA